MLGRPIGRPFDIVKRDTIDAVRCLRVSRHPGPVPLRGRHVRSVSRALSCIPAGESGVVQVKYTDHASSRDDAGMYAFGSEKWRGFVTSFHRRARTCPQVAARRQDTNLSSSSRKAVGHQLVLKSPQGGRARDSLAFSGSNQAREGRLVNALAVRGDEGRDTLR